MKKNPLRAWLLLAFFLFIYTCVYAAPISYLPSSISCVVTACDYADFLNHVATTDSDYLYNEKMGSDSQVACIRRSGVAGSYHYEVIAGRENFPVRYVSDFNKEVYSSELNQPTTDNQQPTTAFLSSNQNDFEIDAAATSTLTLAGTPISHLPSSNRNSCLEEASSIAGIIGLVAFGHELMMRPGETRDGLSPIAESDGEREERRGATDAEEKDQRKLGNRKSPAQAEAIGSIDHTAIRSHLERRGEDALITEMAANAVRRVTAETSSFFPVDRKPTPAEQELATYQPIAQRAHERAIEVSNEARVTKTKAHENNFNEEQSAYQLAERAWIAALEANREVLTKAEALSLSDSDLQPLRAASHNAEVHRMTWEAYHFWLNARKVEHSITTALGNLTREEALHAELAWSEAACCFKKILEKNPTTHRDELLADAIKAEGARSFWSKRAEALKNQESLVAHAMSKGELFKKLTKAQEKAERILDNIEAPLMLDEEAEELGRKAVQQLEAKEKYHQEIIDHVQKSHQLFTQDSVEKYLETTKEKALEAGRERLPGAEEAWVSAKIMAHQAAEEIQQEVDVSSTAEGQHDRMLKNQKLKNLKRAESVPKTYDEAFQLFQKEKERLNHIKMLATPIIATKQKALFRHTEEAVKAYRQGDQALWKVLQPEARREYNQTIESANERYQIEAEKRYKQAIESFHAAALDFSKRFFFSPWKRTSFENTKKAVEQLREATKGEAERRVIIKWFKWEAGERTVQNLHQLIRAKTNELETARKNAEIEEQHQARLYFQVADAKAQRTDFKAKSKEAGVVEKTADAESYDLAAASAYWVSDYLGKAIEALTVGKLEEAAEWEKAAAGDQQGIEFHLKAIEARAGGKSEDAESYDNAGYGASRASERLAKAIEAYAAGKLEEAAQWEKASEMGQQKIEFNLKAIDARAAGKSEDAMSYTFAERYASWASVCLAKAIEARAAGKLEEAAQWKKAATEIQRSVEFNLKAIEARAAGKMDDAESYDNAHSCAFLASCALDQAIQARAAGKEEEAAQCEKVAEMTQRRYEFYLKAIDSRAAGKSEDAESYIFAGHRAHGASYALLKVIQARAAGKLEEAAELEKVAAEDQQGIEFHLKAIEARAERKKEEAAEAKAKEDAEKAKKKKVWFGW